MNILAQSLAGGFFLGISYAVLSAGLALTVNVVEIINLSHGAFYLMGAYLAYSASSFPGLSLLFLAASAAGPALLGLFIARTLVNPLRKDHFSIAVGTLGLAILFEQAADLLWGDRALSVHPGAPLGEILGVKIYPWHAGEILLSGAVFILFFLLPRTKLGLAMRVLAEDEEMAESVGINTNAVRATAFSLSCALASVAGFVSAPGLVLTPTAGRMPLIFALVIVILAGTRRLLPVAALSLGLGMVTFGLALATSAYVEYILLLTAVLVVVSVRRGGLFTLKIERDY
ncbi:MAG: branched-chain amino acid ABC transporter permease [Deltaproteobacteria bacterium]|nr:MAG: branched-chain amino acid ABC transporter permease [Deltaproteobacteria bacterium]